MAGVELVERLLVALEFSRSNPDIAPTYAVYFIENTKIWPTFELQGKSGQG